MKILIVDDEINIARGIKAMLYANISFAILIRCASSGQEAIKLAKEFRPDLLITDIRMPRMNGLELIEVMKEESLCNYFIILSGHEDFAYAQEAIRKGVSDYLTKPVEKEYLCTLCEKFNNCIQEENLQRHDVQLPEFDFLNWNPYQEDYPASLKRIIKYIEQYYTNKDLSGGNISEALFFHHSYISQIIGKYTNRSLNGIINYFRLKKALELLLAAQNYRISEVSEMAGFRSERQMYKVFQKSLLCTPSAFRNEYGINIQRNE